MMPPSFLWGVATSAHQIEGDNRHNDWWDWEQAGRTKGGRSGAACGHWHRWAEDLRLARELGLNAYRFSVEWSRLEPREGEWDEQAACWYDRLLLECARQGLEPMLTLHHFTSPRWFAEKGAFAAAGAETVFGRFARRAAARWGGQVRLWCTINEPLVLVTGTYLAGVMPASGTSLVQGYRAYLGLVRAHDAAYRALHEVAGTGVSVGFAHNMIDFMPARSRKIRDRAASAIVSRVYNRAWLDAVDADFVGVNYYTKGYVRFGAQPHAEYGAAGLPLSVALALPDEPQSDLGWAVHPRGLGKILDAVARTGKPVYVTENGIADAADRLRPQYLRAHVEEVRRALARGVDVRGYFHWSLLDNFEWHLGFGPRFGLYQVDYETLERTPRASAKLYAELIRSFE